MTKGNISYGVAFRWEGVLQSICSILGIAWRNPASEAWATIDTTRLILRRAAAAATLAIGSKAAMIAKSAGGAGGFAKGIGLLAAGA